MSLTQHDVVERQFGDHAAAYVSSAVHAQGADLALLATLVRPRDRVLDLGCGGGHVAYAAAAAGGDVVAYDLSPRMLAVVRQEVAARGLALVTQEGPAERLPFPDENFDRVFSRFSAHHWTDFDAGLHEAARVLRPGGVAAFADVVSPGPAVLDTYLQAVELLRDTSHVRDRSVDEWRSALTAAGLRDIAVTPARLRMDFTPWIARIGTPPELATAIRAVQAAMSDTVRRHFEVEADGSFTIDTAVFLCGK